jgi:hypothetical protein
VVRLAHIPKLTEGQIETGFDRECVSSNPLTPANQSGHSPTPPDQPRKARIWRAFVHLGKSLGGEIDPGRRQIPESLRPTVLIFPFSGVCG